jgi:hypothetical protein
MSPKKSTYIHAFCNYFLQKSGKCRTCKAMTHHSVMLEHLMQEQTEFTLLWMNHYCVIWPEFLNEQLQNPSTQFPWKPPQLGSSDQERTCLVKSVHQIIMFLEGCVSTFRARANSLCIALPKRPWWVCVIPTHMHTCLCSCSILHIIVPLQTVTLNTYVRYQVRPNITRTSAVMTFWVSLTKYRTSTFLSNH